MLNDIPHRLYLKNIAFQGRSGSVKRSSNLSYVRILRRHGTQPLGLRYIFEKGSRHHSITRISIVKNVVKGRTGSKAKRISSRGTLPLNMMDSEAIDK
jgi:hypothetical protein